MGFVFPMAAAVYRLREPLRRGLNRWSTGLAFWLAGGIGGLLTEVFAIGGNVAKPPAERILMHPHPAVDLVFGIFYYGLFMGLWLILRRRWGFSVKNVFLVSGLFGIATEQGGAIVKGMATDPVLGSLTAFLVSSVYGIFPAQAMGLTQNRWPPAPRPGFQAHAVAAFGFFVFWAFYGLVVHRGLLLVFPKP